MGGSYRPHTPVLFKGRERERRGGCPSSSCRCPPPSCLRLAMRLSNRDNIRELFELHGVLKSILNRFSVFAIDIYYFSPVRSSALNLCEFSDSSKLMAQKHIKKQNVFIRDLLQMINKFAALLLIGMASPYQFWIGMAAAIPAIPLPAPLTININLYREYFCVELPNHNVQTIL